MTKPDWSDESAAVWIELKYIRRSSDVRKATEEIAADITKYGDNERRTLFAIYDPGFGKKQSAFLREPVEPFRLGLTSSQYGESAHQLLDESRW
jgi:hypothetical protein